MRFTRLFLATSLVVTAACGRGYSAMDGPSAPAPEEVASQHTGIERAWTSLDATAILPYYSERAVVMTDSDTYNGANDIRTRWLPGIADLSYMRLRTTGWSREGSDIVETGTYRYEVTTDDGTQEMSGGYANRWQRESDGTWRIVSTRIQ